MVTRQELTVEAAVNRVNVRNIRFIMFYVGLDILVSNWLIIIIIWFIVLVQIGLHTKRRTQKISWTLSPKCKSHDDISVMPNAYYEHQCSLSIGQKYTLICKSSAGTGWNSNFLVIENKAYCKNFTDGFEERSTVSIQGISCYMIQYFNILYYLQTSWNC